MKTLTKGLSIEEAVKIAKPFVGNFRAKIFSRPVLKTALVTPEYVIATDSHTLIKLKHTGESVEPRLHHYDKRTEGYTAGQYPQTDRLLPEEHNAQTSFSLDLNEWIEAHDLAKIASKEHKNELTILQENKITVPALKVKTVKGNKNDFSKLTNQKGYKDVNVSDFDQVSFAYSLDTDTNIEKVTYNNTYMLQALKVFKKLKETPTLYFYGPTRPIMLKSETATVLILPVRTY